MSDEARHLRDELTSILFFEVSQYESGRAALLQLTDKLAAGGVDAESAIVLGDAAHYIEIGLAMSHGLAAAVTALADRVEALEGGGGFE